MEEPAEAEAEENEDEDTEDEEDEEELQKSFAATLMIWSFFFEAASPLLPVDEL